MRNRRTTAAWLRRSRRAPGIGSRKRARPRRRSRSRLRPSDPRKRQESRKTRAAHTAHAPVSIEPRSGDERSSSRHEPTPSSPPRSARWPPPRSRRRASSRKTRAVRNIEGPFFRSLAPFRAEIGSGLSLSGVVRDARCRPMRDAVMEIWQADPDGAYDLAGDGFRARLRTDARGNYQLSTAFPGRYLNGATYRPAHIHVKVHANGRPPPTTQLHFPRDPYNDRDPWFRSSLVVQLGPPPCCHPSTRHARFDFVV